jgi:hypothetical protein
MTLAPRLQKAVDMGISGLDIVHGELKNLMLEAEKEYLHWQSVEEETGYDDAMDSMERKYWEGMLDAYSTIYQLTYELSFAEKDLTNKA